MSKRKISRRRKAIFYLILILFPICATFVLGEVMIAIFKPVVYMYPRYKYSPQYGFILYENSRMVHGRPGKFKFHYTVNEFGYRGKAIDPSEAQEKPNIVILGDSYSFGMGVNDGEQYAAVLGTELAHAYNVINLGTPGWGLTQQIRRYYEFGELYRPDFVVLQYCPNDPEDNFNNMVTTIESGEFKFSNTNAGVNRIKKFLSHSIIQKSQIYNFCRQRLYVYFQHKYVDDNRQELEEKIEPEAKSRHGSMAREQFYCDLLELFSRSLEEQGVKLIMISTVDITNEFENIAGCVDSFEVAGILEYVDITDWLNDVEERHSPEGHWSTEANRVIGSRLAELILSLEGP